MIIHNQQTTSVACPTWLWALCEWQSLQLMCVAERQEQPHQCTSLRSADGLSSPYLSSPPTLFPGEYTHLMEIFCTSFCNNVVGI